MCSGDVHIARISRPLEKQPVNVRTEWNVQNNTLVVTIPNRWNSRIDHCAQNKCFERQRINANDTAAELWLQDLIELPVRVFRLSGNDFIKYLLIASESKW